MGSVCFALTVPPVPPKNTWHIVGPGQTVLEWMEESSPFQLQLSPLRRWHWSQTSSSAKSHISSCTWHFPLLPASTQHARNTNPSLQISIPVWPASNSIIHPPCPVQNLSVGLSPLFLLLTIACHRACPGVSLLDSVQWNLTWPLEPGQITSLPGSLPWQTEPTALSPPSEFLQFVSSAPFTWSQHEWIQWIISNFVMWFSLISPASL